MDFKDIKVEKYYYKITQTLQGVKIERVKIKTKLISIKAVLAIDDSGREIKIYNDAIRHLKTYNEALVDFKNHPKGPPKVAGSNRGFTPGTHCWSCHSDINYKTAITCPGCKWKICPVCRACGCNYFNR